jgi:GNAT superfamily N-acetyltransferase
MHHKDIARSAPLRGYVRTLRQQELPLLRDHLLRLGPHSRHDRFNGFLDDSFIERYAAKCASDGTLVVAYLEDGVVRGAAELHSPERSPDGLPEIAFSVEAVVRRRGVGSSLFQRLIAEARLKGYGALRITTSAENHAMRALAGKFGAQLNFVRGESTGIIDLKPPSQLELAKLAIAAPADSLRAAINLNRVYWKAVLRMYGWGRAA